MTASDGMFSRSALLVGEDAMREIAGRRVIVFGVGGVGSWCAEGLVRSGIRHLTIVDPDTVAISNINRQIQATSLTVGRPKVEVLRDRLLEINPQADVVALSQTFTDETAGDFALGGYDFVVDAIDSLKDKIALILHATRSGAVLFSSMGAALKTDPRRVRVAEFWDVRGCPLGAMLRKRIRQGGVLPAKRFLCVYSDEVMDNKGVDGTAPMQGSKRVNGTFVHITAIFGMTLCGLVIDSVLSSL